MPTEVREFDIIILGATGFTGELTAEHALQYYDCSQGGAAQRDGCMGTIRLGLAGRNSDRLSAVHTRLMKKFGARSIPPTGLVMCDAMNAAECRALARRTLCVASTVGPYMLYGEQLVAACASEGTHYCDITGEAPFIAQMENKYGQTAIATGAKIVHSCGFDSVPSDLGVYLLQHHATKVCGGPCHTIEFRLTEMRGGPSGGTLRTMMNLMDTGTAATGPFYLCKNSLQHACGDQKSLQATQTRQPKIGMCTYDADRQRWVSWWLMAGFNGNIVRWSNQKLQLPYGTDFAYSEALDFGMNKISTWLTSFGINCYLGAMYFRCTRAIANLFLPAPGQGPSRDTLDNGYFVAKLYGIALDAHNDNAPKRLTATFASRKGDPGYHETAKMLFESARCLALEADKCNQTAGSLTPASAIGNPLIDALNRTGMEIRIDPN